MSNPSPLEKTVEAFLVKCCKALGWYCAKFVSPSSRGAPDRIVAIPQPTGPARVFFIELKREGEAPTKLQTHIHETMRGYGMEVVVLAGRAEVAAWIAEVQK